MTEQSDDIERTKGIARALLERTRLGSVRWKPTDDESTYLCRMKRGSFLLEKGYYRTITVLDGEGRTIQQVHVPPTDEVLFGEMTELWELARRDALQIDDLLDSFLDELSPTLEIIEAKYGAKGVEADVTNAVRRNVDEGQRLIMLVDNDSLGGDPVPNEPKTLVLRYKLHGDEIVESFQEGAAVEFP